MIHFQCPTPQYQRILFLGVIKLEWWHQQMISSILWPMSTTLYFCAPKMSTKFSLFSVDRLLIFIETYISLHKWSEFSSNECNIFPSFEIIWKIKFTNKKENINLSFSNWMFVLAARKSFIFCMKLNSMFDSKALSEHSTKLKGKAETKQMAKAHKRTTLRELNYTLSK